MQVKIPPEPSSVTLWDQRFSDGNFGVGQTLNFDMHLTYTASTFGLLLVCSHIIRESLLPEGRKLGLGGGGQMGGGIWEHL